MTDTAADAATPAPDDAFPPLAEPDLAAALSVEALSEYRDAARERARVARSSRST